MQCLKCTNDAAPGKAVCPACFATLSEARQQRLTAWQQKNSDLDNGQTAKSSGSKASHIPDRDTCERRIKYGGIAAMISAGLTAIVAGIGFTASFSDEQLTYLFDPWSLVDALLVFILGLFVFNKSRVASTILFIHFVVSKVVISLQMGKPTGLYVAGIFFCVYFIAMISTFQWNRYYKNQNS